MPCMPVLCGYDITVLPICSVAFGLICGCKAPFVRLLLFWLSRMHPGFHTGAQGTATLAQRAVWLSISAAAQQAMVARPYVQPQGVHNKAQARCLARSKAVQQSVQQALRRYGGSKPTRNYSPPCCLRLEVHQTGELGAAASRSTGARDERELSQLLCAAVWVCAVVWQREEQPAGRRQYC